MRHFLLVLLLAAVMSAAVQASLFYDDFSDGDISDWEIRCLPGTWWPSTAMVHGSTNYTCSVLVPPGDITAEDCTVSIRGMGVHTLGVVARLNSEDSGIYAYVSPDHDVARIRRINSNGTSTIYSSIEADFPSSVWYELTLTCSGSMLQLSISVPSTGGFWAFSANDPNPRSGEFGLAIGDEPSAFWDWISVENLTGIGEEEGLSLAEQSMSMWPNPFRESITISLTGMTDGPLSVEIYDLSGRLVASPHFVGENGDRTMVWDGRSNDGSVVPSGIYTVIPSGSRELVQTLVKLE